MKKFFTLVGLAVISISASAQLTQRNALKINPISMIVKTGNISYEMAIAKNQSVQLGGFFSGLALDDLKYEGFGITPEYRYYFGGNKEVMNGGYVAPFARFQQFSVADKSADSKAKFQTIGGGAVIGWERRYNSGFVLDFFAGPSYSNIRFKNGREEDFDIKGGMSGFGLRTGISIGFSF